MDRSSAPVSHKGCHWAFRAICSSSAPSLCAPKVYCLKSPHSSIEFREPCSHGMWEEISEEEWELSPWPLGLDWMGRAERIIDWDTAGFSKQDKLHQTCGSCWVIPDTRQWCQSLVCLGIQSRPAPWTWGFRLLPHSSWEMSLAVADGESCSKVLMSSSAAAGRPSRDFCDLTSGIAFSREAKKWLSIKKMW